MTELALIPPFSLADDFVDEVYYMYLAPLLGNAIYDRYVWRTTTRLSHNILDNGAFEGEPVPDDRLMLLATSSGLLDEVVVPDVLGDVVGTLEKVRQFESVVKSAGAHAPKHYMGVVQGETYTECVECIEQLTEYSYITTLGIPKHLLATVGPKEIRLMLAAYIEERYKRRLSTHFLGSSPIWPSELREAARFNVRSMDTSMPFVFAYYNQRIQDDISFSCMERPPKYFLQPKSAFNNVLWDNISIMRRWASGK
jgi:hypothetical protein